MVLMAAVCVVSFATGLFFFLLGAWPVIGFMGLDVALIYVAFRLNFRALKLYETVDLTQDALTVTRFDGTRFEVNIVASSCARQSSAEAGS